VTADRLTSDRVGCPRIDDQQAGQGLDPLLSPTKEVTTKRQIARLWK
jgi:hypothetical protein